MKITNKTLLEKKMRCFKNNSMTGFQNLKVGTKNLN